MKNKILTVDYYGHVIDMAVDDEISEFEKSDFWKEKYRMRKIKNHEESYEDLVRTHEEIFRSGLPAELTSEPCEEIYLKRDTYQKLYAAVNRLPEKQRRRIILRYFYNISVKEIAQIEKTTSAAIVQSIQNTLKTLRKYC